MTTNESLLQVFYDNFAVYFRSQVAHVNIQGRNFYSDHKLLGKIYEDLQAQIDVIAELLRSREEFMPTSLSEIIDQTSIIALPVEGNSTDLLNVVNDDLAQLKTTYLQLMMIADEEEVEEISNYAQERVLVIGKYQWMLDSTLAD